MSHNKPRYNQIKENDPTNKDTSSEHQAKAYEEFYTEKSPVRKVCFVWLDGKRVFMNYSYLVSGEYLPDANTIIIKFTTQSFILKGINLESLFYDIMTQMGRQITCVDERYNLIGEGERFVVNVIEVIKHRS